MFADKAAAEVLERIKTGTVVEVMEGLEKLSHIKSSSVTAGVIDVAIARSEFHVAEYAGAALAAADPEGAIDAISKLLTGGRSLDAAELRQIAGILAFLPGPRAPEILAGDRLAGARSEEIRLAAIRGLGLHRSNLAMNVVLDALGSKSPALRNAACVALGRSGDKRAIAPLLSKLDQKEGGTGGFAAVALGRIEDDSVFSAIAQHAGQGNTEDKGKALIAAARPKHADRLRGMLKGGSSDSKIAAAAALGKIADKDLETQRALLDLMLSDSDRFVRHAAFHGLGRCATADLAPVLAKRMGQTDPEKEMYVFEIAGDIAAKECVDRIEDAAWTEKNTLLRRVAMDAFWRLRDPAAIARAEAKIREATGANFVRAMEFLALRRNQNGFEMALELLERSKPGSREQWEIEKAIDKQTGHFFGPDVNIWREWWKKNPKFFEKEQAAIERAKWREDFLKEAEKDAANTSKYASASKQEKSVQMALDYLARHQDPSGAFDQQHFLDMCAKPGCPVSDGSRVQFDCVGVSGLCVLAFFGAACEPEKGRYGGVLHRAMEYMLSRQLASGDYVANDLIGGYNRPLALQAYAEAANVTHDPQYKGYIQRGVDFMACIQAEKGGWRYRVVDNANDTSVVAWVLFGAKSAQKAGASVRTSIFEGCDLVLGVYQDRPDQKDQREDYIKDIDPRYEFEVGVNTTYEFHTGYQNANFELKYATTGLGLMSRILLGYRRSHPFCIGSANKVRIFQLPEVPKSGDLTKVNFRQEYPMYHMYYGTLSMHQMGGKYFREWKKPVKEILIGTQETAGCNMGSWSGWNFDRFFSRLYTTAIGALTLETEYRYAPILQE